MFPDAFKDPSQGESILVFELLDHIFLSPGLWTGSSGFRYDRRTGKVEHNLFDQHDDDDPAERKRGLRPSDHRPVSAVIRY